MRAALESLLRARKLDGTLTDGARPGERSAPTGVAALDEALGGGLRRGQLSEITGAPSSGRTTLAIRALAAAAARGEACALVDTCDTFDPVSAAAHGIALAQLLWVRPSAPAAASGADVTAAASRADAIITRALKAFSLILRAGGFGLVVFDVADVAGAALRRCPPTTWMRLARSVEGGDTAAVLIGADRVARSAGGVTIACESAAVGWRGAGHRARVFAGLAAAPRVVGGRW